MAECFHILRNNVDSLLPRPDEGGHVIMLTSTTPGEGKTFTSANLAATFAKAGRKVLLIDGDLRKFSLTRQMGGHGRRGLTSILLNQVDDPFHIIRQAGENNTPFDFLGTGPAAPNPSRCLASLSWHRYWNVSEKNTMPSSLTHHLTAYWQIQPSLRL